MKVIYIAGPFRGPNAWEVEQNIRRAETLALGAKAEREYARNHRISVHYDLEDLVDYYEWCGIGR